MGHLIYVSLSVLFGVLISLLPSPVTSQSTSRSTTNRDRVIADLNKVLHFVISPNAKPSEDLITVAMMLGGSPKTPEERSLYLDLMQQIARNTSDVVKVFTNTVTNFDGTISQTLDGLALDSYITDRARLYMRKRRKEKKEAAMLAALLATAPPELAKLFAEAKNTTSSPSATAAATGSTPTPLVSNTPGKPDGLSLLELFGIGQGSNNLGQKNNDLFINTTPMFFF